VQQVGVEFYIRYIVARNMYSRKWTICTAESVQYFHLF